MLLYCRLCLVILKSKNGENTSSAAFYKKLYSESTIQQNGVYFTAPNVVYREVVPRGFLVFPLSKPWPLYRTDTLLTPSAMVPTYFHIRDGQLQNAPGWGRGGGGAFAGGSVKDA